LTSAVAIAHVPTITNRTAASQRVIAVPSAKKVVRSPGGNVPRSPGSDARRNAIVESQLNKLATQIPRAMCCGFELGIDRVAQRAARRISGPIPLPGTATMFIFPLRLC
ncbi:MAG: hypothetical protein OEZ08_00800, partial [Betaproteobacteria bacterium]|nr:hypothetical protein [Betaproteobacteria bacterium]